MKKLILFSLTLLICASVFPQKIKLNSGSMASIKGEDVFEVRFTYNNMRVGRLTEEEYVQNKKTEANNRDNDGGERWHNAWVNDRANRFEPKFIELFNKYAKKPSLVLDLNREDTRFIMIVNTYFTEPGFNIGVQSRKSEVSLLVTFVERSNPAVPIAVFDVIKSPGTPVYDMGMRIQEAYAKAGKALAKVICKHLK